MSAIQPVILAGGLGTRLRPRTNILPKPLLPVAGRPLLWYAMQTTHIPDFLPPIVVVGYLGELIKAFFQDLPGSYLHIPHQNMAEAVLAVAKDHCNVNTIIGLSSDVIVPKYAAEKILQLYRSTGGMDTVLFVKLPVEGHKKWNFVISSGRLIDIRVEDTRTNYERVLLILNRDSLLKSFSELPSEISEDTLPPELAGFQLGWNLIMKAMLRASIPIAAELVDIPVCNVNVSSDFLQAEQFVASYGPW